MPSVLRRSGQDYEKNGQTITPRAVVHFCEACGFEGAAFGETIDGKLLSYCGWVNNQPACVGKKEAT